MPNELAKLFDRYCSDKGTFWQSKHHYGSAYHSLFEQWRDRPIKLLEIGIGEDTAPSIATWLDYFPRGHIIAVDIKNGEDFRRRAAPRRNVATTLQFMSDSTLLPRFLSSPACTTRPTCPPL